MQTQRLQSHGAQVDRDFWEIEAQRNHMMIIACHEDPVVWEASGYADAMAVAAMIDEPASKTVIDWGCGSGRDTKYLAAVFKHVIAFDWSETMLSKVRDLKLPNVTTAVEVPDRRVDVVFSTQCWFHFRKSDLFSVIAQVRRCLNPGGQVIFQLPVYDIGRDRQADQPNEISCWTRDEIINLFDSNGFHLVKLTSNPGQYTVGNWGPNHFVFHRALLRSQP